MLGSILRFRSCLALIVVALTIVVVALAINVSCEGLPVDFSRPHPVLYRNATDFRVVVFYGTPGYRPTRFAQLERGETRNASWLVRRYHPAHTTVWVYDETGKLVFCENYSYTYESALREPVVVEIVDGTFDCEQPG